jgi:hypothetical protein
LEEGRPIFRTSNQAQRWPFKATGCIIQKLAFVTTPQINNERWVLGFADTSVLQGCKTRTYLGEIRAAKEITSKNVSGPGVTGVLNGCAAASIDSPTMFLSPT